MTLNKAQRLAAQDGRCAYCRKEISVMSSDPARLATWDEIVPVSRGGTRRSCNRIVACLPCNARKADRDVREFAPGWSPDPRWSLGGDD